MVCRLAGVSDPRLSGSCNPGFSNVLRLHGTRLALATLLVDTVKGMPVLGLALLRDLPPWAQGSWGSVSCWATVILSGIAFGAGGPSPAPSA